MIKMSKNLEKNTRKMSVVHAADAIDDAINVINAQICALAGTREDGGALDALLATKAVLSAQWNELNRRLREEDY